MRTYHTVKIQFSRNLPISKNVPPRAKHRTEANSLSSDSEFNTKSTPRPLVRRIINCSNEQSRELPMFSSVWIITNKSDMLEMRYDTE